MHNKMKLFIIEAVVKTLAIFKRHVGVNIWHPFSWDSACKDWVCPDTEGGFVMGTCHESTEYAFRGYGLARSLWNLFVDNCIPRWLLRLKFRISGIYWRYRHERNNRRRAHI
jgi:hypothetical protein